MKKEKGTKCSNCGKIIGKNSNVYLYFNPLDMALTISMINKPVCKECAEKYERANKK